MSTGRPPEKAPVKGYLTVRQASERLGIPYTTLLNRIKKKRIAAVEETTQGGEQRYYISEETVRYQLNQTPEPLTRDHLEETEVALEEQVETNRQIIEQAVERLVDAMAGIGFEVSEQRLEVSAHLAGIAATLEAQNEYFAPLIHQIITNLERLERIEHSSAEARSNSAGLIDLQKELIRLQREKTESDRLHQQMIAEHIRRGEEHRERVEERLKAMEGADAPRGRSAWWRRWFGVYSI